MSSLFEINQEFKIKVDKLINFYRYHYKNIMRAGISNYRKKYYLSSLKNYCNNLYNNYLKIKQQKIKEFYEKLSENQNLSNNNITIEKKNYNALMVGINYSNNNYNISELNGCVDDINRLKNAFEENKNINFNNLTLLNDNSEKKPTKYHILNELKNLLVYSKKNDTLIFAYSGHGHYVYDSSNDEEDNKDEVLVSIDGKLIKDDEIRDIIKNYLKNEVTLFVIFDCCHSGTLMDLKYKYLSKNNYNEITINENYEDTKGNVYFISGCRDDQYSYESYLDGEQQGALTWSFIDCLESKKKLSWKNLVLSMREKIKEKKLNQIPQFSCGKKIDINSDFIFC